VIGNAGGKKKWELERKIAVDTGRRNAGMWREADRQMGTEMNRTKRVIKCAVKQTSCASAFCPVVLDLEPCVCLLKAPV
jgi:hypothetical protein